MIHGGIKYTLSGALSGASEAIAGMPEYWRSCLRGEGDIDLRGGKVLSDHFYLWSSSSTASKVSTFLASKAIRGRVDKVSKNKLPALLQNPRFKGSVYKLIDMVLDVPGILQLLVDRAKDSIYQIDWQHAHFVADKQTAATTLQINTGSEILNIESAAVVLAAGQGNQTLLHRTGATGPAMQRRPLQQIMVKHRNPHLFYGHCLGAESTPRLTISSHPCADGSQIWYMGGAIAAKGAELPAGMQIDRAKQELTTLLPWVDLNGAEWATLAIDRAEPLQRDFARPDQAYASWADNCTNVIAAWPTKLTLAPSLGNEVVRMLNERSIKPVGIPLPHLTLPKPTIAPAPWQLAFGA